MNFRDFLEHSELEEASISDPLKFAAGAASNFATQSARGVGNVVRGMAGSAGGMADIALGGLQAATGRRKAGTDRIRKGWAAGQQGGKRIGVGALQAAGALSGVTPLLRGGQATSEPMLPTGGVYSPSGAEKGSLRDIFGLGPGDSAQQPATPPKPDETKPAPPRREIPAQERPEEWDRMDRAADKRADTDKRWDELWAEYKKAGTPSERKRIEMAMAILDPDRYARALAASRRKKRTR